MWNFILTLFGLGKSGTPAVASRPPSRTPVQVTKKSTLRGKYYRRGNEYYSCDDDSLIEDILLIGLLTEMYDEGDINEYEGEIDVYADPVTEAPEENLLDMDVSSTPVEAVPETEWKIEVPADVEPTPPTFEPEPEPTRYSSGSSFASGSSDYDSGSSDSGGSSDD
jgi:hypothetical protein